MSSIWGFAGSQIKQQAHGGAIYSKKSNRIDRKLIVLGVPHGFDFFASILPADGGRSDRKAGLRGF